MVGPSMENESRLTLRDALAAERTFLAWIRTGLALMGLGFVLARFGLFLREMGLLQSAVRAQPYSLSLWFGTALILLGVAVCVLSLLRYLRLLKQASEGSAAFLRPSLLGVTIAAVLAVLGLAMAAYLLSARSAAQNISSHTEEAPVSEIPENGILRIPGNHSVDQTVSKLQEALKAKGVKLFAVVDHSGEAASASLKMPNTKLLIFGNPKAGTLLMLASPSAALDLPLKILVAEDSAGKTWISYNAPAYLQTRHKLPADLLPNIAVIEGIAAKAAE
jgi:uncharacterized protein (DUF302 family)/uncharacterized membrane protein YidH (DUF202 family)